MGSSAWDKRYRHIRSCARTNVNPDGNEPLLTPCFTLLVCVVLQVVLRDGRHLVGVMRSYDQFSNIVLEDTHERHFVGGESGAALCCSECQTWKIEQSTGGGSGESSCAAEF